MAVHELGGVHGETIRVRSRSAHDTSLACGTSPLKHSLREVGLPQLNAVALGQHLAEDHPISAAPIIIPVNRDVIHHSITRYYGKA